MNIGTKIIIYTMILRGAAQNSYVGQVIEINDYGVTIDSSTGKMFFPWGAVERITF